MAKRKGDEKPGYGKLLDAWVAPDNAGDPIGCLATSFTFSPVFFEEECLARFLQLESDPTEDGPVYLVEREQKLAQLSCAAALVDQRHCQGLRNLRWDLISARLPQGIQHAKVSLLYWSKLCRLIVGSANLTEDGYRRNLEVFGIVDFSLGGEAPVSCLVETITFLRRLGESGTIGNVESPPIQRWNKLLNRVFQECITWGVTNQEMKRTGVKLRTVFSGPGYPTVFDQLREAWPGASPPDTASVVSPFFDPPEAENAPAKALWGLLRQRGEASIGYFVTGEDIPGEEGLVLNAPESLLRAEPQGRPSISTHFHRVVVPDGRSLHAKGIRIEDTRWTMYQMGSSNFSSAGTGLSKAPNYEANLVYRIDSNRDPELRNAFANTFPTGELVDLDAGVRWTPRTDDSEDNEGNVLLPPAFGEATFDVDANQQVSIVLSITGSPPLNWEISIDGESKHYWSEQEWLACGRKTLCRLPWDRKRPPSGFWVHWAESPGSAWWPVNVSDGEVLPPPDELKNLPLEVLINILESARPLHRVLREYLKRRKPEEANIDNSVVVDPHKRVDTSQFLLQRTRRVSRALNSLRKRLEHPVVTVESLRWRLRGPVGVMAFAEALIREARSDEESVFLLSELILELFRMKPEVQSGCLDAVLHREEIQSVMQDLIRLRPEIGNCGPENLRRYIASVIATVRP